MKEVAVYEAKARLSDLLDDVEHGDEVTITRRGVAVARLVPAAPEADGAERQREMVADIFKSLRLHREETVLDAREAAAQGRD